MPSSVAAGGPAATLEGNALTTSRRLAVLAVTYADEPDWTAVANSGTPATALAQAASLLETETFTKAFAYDALNRPTSATMPDLSELRPTYNEAGLLEAIDVRIRGAAACTASLTAIAYAEKGRRSRIDWRAAYGAGGLPKNAAGRWVSESLSRLQHLAVEPKR